MKASTPKSAARKVCRAWQATHRWLGAGAVCALLLAGCGGGGGGGGTVVSVTATVGPDGGTVSSLDNKAKAFIPPGALTNTIEVTVQPLANGAAGQVGNAYTFGPDGTAFGTSAYITVAYDEADLPSGQAESNLVLAELKGGTWTQVPNGVIDTATNTAGAPVAHFSDYGIIVAAPDTEAPVVQAPKDFHVVALGALTRMDIGWAVATDNVDGVVPVSVDTTGPFSIGTHTITWSATDQAGNVGSATQTITVDPGPAPVVTVLSPDDGALLGASPVTVAGRVDDPLSEVSVNGVPAGAAQGGFSADATLAEGPNTIVVTAAGSAGGVAEALVTVTLDTTPPVVAITAPAGGVQQRLSAITVSGTVDGPVTRVSVNGVPATLTGNDFSAPGVPLVDGDNTLTARAVDAAGNAGKISVVVPADVTPPRVVITAPADLSTVAAGPVTVSGSVDDPGATLTVNGAPAANAGGGFSVPGVTLVEGMNTLMVRATDAAGNVGAASVNVTLDTTAPRVTILSPVEGHVATASPVVVTGQVNDLVRGTVNGGQAQVLVSGVAATVVNRTFTASVPLSEGPNTLEAVATDAAGNLGRGSVDVTLDSSARARINLVSGSGQSGVIGTPLPAPLVVSVTDAAGQPVPNRTVVFRVVENNGTLSDGVVSDQRAIALASDAAGEARVTLTLGSWVGQGNNRVEATASGFAGTALFSASAVAAPASAIYVAQGGQQRGGAGHPLPDPLVVLVTDAGHNPVAGTPVTFTSVAGGGTFAGGVRSVTVNTDDDGRAAAAFILGPQPGNDANVVEATFPGNTGDVATFAATGLVTGDPGQTAISGVVLDNTNTPIPGVTARVEGTLLEGVSDDAGRFAIANVPVGAVHLIVDGTTAGQPGVTEYPTLSYEITTIAGADNTVGMPIYLVPLDIANAALVGTQDATLAVPELPGFSLDVRAGSVTFPNGDRQGLLSVTQVHADKVPMVPQIGQQPEFIVTIQPAGVVFDPPARLTLPNTGGLAPGEKTNMYSFDHDLEAFVSIGTGTVSEDGTVIASDPGSGVVKSGWHCGGNPQQTGGTAIVSLSAPNRITVAPGDVFPITVQGNPPRDVVYEWSADPFPTSSLPGHVNVIASDSCPDSQTCTARFEATDVGLTEVISRIRCTTTGVTDVEVTEVLVQEVTTNLELMGLPEETANAAHELMPGAAIPVNEDDDNGDGQADNTPLAGATRVAGEDDLVPMFLATTPRVVRNGTLTLDAFVGRDNIRVWLDPEKTTEVPLPNVWDLSVEKPPVRVYVEGVAQSGGTRDVRLRLTYESGAGAFYEDIAYATVVRVSFVNWYAGGTLITDPNPHPGGTVGVRYFPGADSASFLPPGPDFNDRIAVRAGVAPPVAGAQVWFATFDPDDPSANNDEVDHDGATSAPDNRGAGYFPVPGDTSPRPVGSNVRRSLTDANGIAEADYIVSHQPGDNHRVGAALLAPIVAPHSLIPVSDAQLPGPRMGMLSPLLTVWRRLHVEVDSMRAPTFDELYPDAQKLAVTQVIPNFPPIGTPPCMVEMQMQEGNVGCSTLVLSDNLRRIGHVMDEGHFEGGTVDYGGPSPLRIIDSTNHSDPLLDLLPGYDPPPDELVVVGTVGAALASRLEGSVVTIRDDDTPTRQPPITTAMELIHAAHPGEPISSIITPWVKAQYRHAYIDIVEIGSADNVARFVDFDPYIGATSMNFEAVAEGTAIGFAGGRDVKSFEAYWQTLVVLTYQGKSDLDADPDVIQSPRGELGRPAANQCTYAEFTPVFDEVAVREYNTSGVLRCRPGEAAPEYARTAGNGTHPTAIFVEHIRDDTIRDDQTVGRSNHTLIEATVAHEIGHVAACCQTELDHAQQGIMRTGAAGSRAGFTPHTLNKFRSVTDWSDPSLAGGLVPRNPVIQ